jgi:integrase
VAKARKEAKLPPLEPWTIHDLRRTGATKMAELGVTRFVIGRVLNHADREVTGIYDRHSYLPEKRHGMDLWGARLLELVEPGNSNVVRMRRLKRSAQ